VQPNFSERVLFVHAHPDDETIATGATIAALIAQGAEVTVLTCTRGERGEVIPPELAALEGTPALADYREHELAAAMAALGVVDHRYLGSVGARRSELEPRRYLDSGMKWGAKGAEALDETDTLSLSAAPLGEVAADIATVVAQFKPTAVVSYDATGGYGHPDHIRAGEAAQRAAEIMRVPFFEIKPENDISPMDAASLPFLPGDVSAALARKTAALRAHRTQITVNNDNTFALSSGPARPITAQESFARVYPAAAPTGSVPWSEQGFGTHLFAWIVALLIGLSLGAISTVNHQFEISVGKAQLPVGIVVSLVLIAALLVGLRIVFSGRLIAFLAALGIVVSIAVLSLAGGGGSVLVPANTAGYLLTYAPVVIALVVLGWPTTVQIVNGKIVLRPEPKRTPPL
jgi:N-acetyl-1-D-myo-inositol-2-amino-2-deoxy-alpha-D-glucopyranoside deacetylase